jgi:hypothetical protein
MPSPKPSEPIRKWAHANGLSQNQFMRDLFSLPLLRQKITDLRIVPQAVADRFGRHRRLLGVRVAKPIRKPLQKVLMALS